MLDLAEATTIHCPLGWWVQAGLKVVLVHENDKEKGGCEFGDFFGTTPHELIDDGIYRLACRLILIARCPTEHVRSN